MEVTDCRCPQNSCFEDFQDVTSAARLKMKSTTNIYSESCKTF